MNMPAACHPEERGIRFSPFLTKDARMNPPGCRNLNYFNIIARNACTVNTGNARPLQLARALKPRLMASNMMMYDSL